MRKLILSCLCLTLLVTVKADCIYWGIWCWPSGNMISKNPVLVIDFHGHSERLVAQLNKKNGIYLQSDRQKIPLAVLSINAGVLFTQAVVKPVQELTIDQTYRLVIDSSARFEQPARMNRRRNEEHSAVWTVVDHTDSQQPGWVQTPKFLSRTFTQLGCGPESWINFSFSVRNNSAFLVSATVKDISSGETKKYLIPVYDSTIRVGRGMCGGAFEIREKTNYQVSFALMDESGHFSSYTPATTLLTKTGSPTPAGNGYLAFIIGLTCCAVIFCKRA